MKPELDCNPVDIGTLSSDKSSTKVSNSIKKKKKVLKNKNGYIWKQQQRVVSFDESPLKLVRHARQFVYQKPPPSFTVCMPRVYHLSSHT